MDKIQVLLYSLGFDILLGVSMILYAVQDLHNGSYSTNAYGITIITGNPWNWGVFFVGIILLIESVAVWAYVTRKN